MALSNEQLEEIKAKVNKNLKEAGLEQESGAVELPSQSNVYEMSAVPADDLRALAAVIDHTLLKPAAMEPDIKKVCEEARAHGFASVCINPIFVPTVAMELRGTSVKVCTVIGFPLGANTSAVKAHEVTDALENGAQELDMVLPVGALKRGDYSYVFQDIRAVVAAAEGNTVKVILETGLLTDEEKAAGCLIAKAAGADFVKTSTGFSGGGATVEDIELMRRVVGPEMGVKASGGIRDYESARAMLNAGATRLGCSAGVAIISGGEGKGAY